MFPSSKNSNGSNLHKYSTQEHIVGTWIDGKPIYEKTYHNVAMSGALPLNSYNRTVIDTNSNIDTLIKAGGMIHYEYGAYTQHELPYCRVIFNNNVTSSASFSVDIQKTNGEIALNGYVTGGIGYTISDLSFDITVQYTKTTDL